ncbi:hypothetical protein RclHR1_03610001 [Rhizophagus clarus]|uniref:Uncharacterized protein n=1 Tax=Rhizophagus clarus TaxID=94130 RepID=A0A2Z6RBB0_9GLOM|nr:hypothetical protein RclHR1_03610001 [Rhizophagus clarus]
MSNNNRNNNTSARTLRSSSKVAQPAATFDFTFTSNAADPPPWSKDTATNNALQADLAADKERIKQSNLQSKRDVAIEPFLQILSTTRLRPLLLREKLNPKNSRFATCHMFKRLPNKISNNLDRTNRTPALAAPTTITD